MAEVAWFPSQFDLSQKPKLYHVKCQELKNQEKVIGNKNYASDTHLKPG